MEQRRRRGRGGAPTALRTTQELICLAANAVVEGKFPSYEKAASTYSEGGCLISAYQIRYYVKTKLQPQGQMEAAATDEEAAQPPLRPREEWATRCGVDAGLQREDDAESPPKRQRTTTCSLRAAANEKEHQENTIVDLRAENKHLSQQLLLAKKNLASTRLACCVKQRRIRELQAKFEKQDVTGHPHVKQLENRTRCLEVELREQDKELMKVKAENQRLVDVVDAEKDKTKRKVDEARAGEKRRCGARKKREREQEEKYFKAIENKDKQLRAEARRLSACQVRHARDVESKNTAMDKLKEKLKVRVDHNRTLECRVKDLEEQLKDQASLLERATADLASAEEKAAETWRRSNSTLNAELNRANGEMERTKAQVLELMSRTRRRCEPGSPSSTPPASPIQQPSASSPADTPSPLARPEGEGAGKGRPYSSIAVEFGKALVGLGISDRKCEEICALVSAVVLNDPSGTSTPRHGWFCDRRVLGGLEATAFTWLRILRADRICQLGYDETKIDRQSHLDVWVTLPKEGSPTVEKVVISSGIILVDETAKGIAQTVYKVFERGSAVLVELRDICMEQGWTNLITGDMDAATLFLKVRSVMHDTCNTANLAAQKLADLKEEKGREVFGEEAWRAMDKNVKELVDSLCLNHGRNLHIKAYDRLSEVWLSEHLSSYLAEVKDRGFNVRTEVDAPSFLHSVAKLLSPYYEKSSSCAWGIFSRNLSPEVRALPAIGRAEVGNRQDAGLFMAWRVFLRWPALFDFTHMLHDANDLGKGNMLVETIRVKVACAALQADIHARALLWEFVYEEVRARANLERDGKHLTQAGVLALLEALWVLGHFLQNQSLEAILDLFASGVADIFPTDPRLEEWQHRRQCKVLVPARHGPDGQVVPAVRVQDYARDLLLMKTFQPDRLKYDPLLLGCLQNFGRAMHISLRRTYSKFLDHEGCDGSYAERIRDVERKQVMDEMLPTNDLCESIFAKSKRILKERPLLKFENLSMLVMCSMSGWYRSSNKDLIGPGFSRSPAIPPHLREAIQHFAISRGKLLIRGWFKEDMDMAVAHETQRLEAAREARSRALASKAAKDNYLREVSLLTSSKAVDALIKPLAGDWKNDVILKLKQQIQARTVLRKWAYPDVDTRVTPPKDRDPLDHLSSTLKNMIRVDKREKRKPQLFSVPAAAASSTRLPPPPLPTTQAQDRMKLDELRAEQLKPQDDPKLLELERTFVGKCFHDEQSSTAKVWQVAAVRWRQYGKKSMWVLECNSVRLDENGSPCPASPSINGARQPVLLSKDQDHHNQGEKGMEVADYVVQTEANEADILKDMEEYIRLYGKQPAVVS